jgi:PAS domain S-box-containing protein
VWAALVDAPTASLVCSEDGRLLFANQAMIELIGVPLEGLLAIGWIPLLFPDPAEQTSARVSLGDLLSSTGTARHRKEMLSANGARTVELTLSAVRLPDGSRGVMVLAIGSTIQRAPRNEAIERGFRELIEDLPDLLVRLSSDGHRPIYLNRAVERLTGYSAEELYADGELWTRIVAPEYRSIWQVALAQVTRGDARAFDLCMVHRSGRRVILQQTLYPIRDPRGRVQFIEGSARDITSVRQIEELKARNEERTSLDRLKSQLLANVSHELRTPLVSIKGYNELLLRGALGPLTPRQRRGLEIAGANTERLIELIETLLDFARREEGRLELHATRFDVRIAVQDAIGALEERIASRHLTLRMDLGSEPLEVLGDRSRLAQVFRALIGNAEKFSEGPTEARVDGEIKVRAWAIGDTVAISITDRGIGIPKEAHAKIFDRFYQVDASSTRRFGGAGLGLALAKELVTLHSGQIDVDSAEGRGSTFTVRLPRAATVERPVDAVVARPVVLVGCDEPQWRCLKPTLEDAALAPLDLFWAPSEPEVVRRAKRHRPDLVVLGFSTVAGIVDDLRRDPETSNLPLVVLCAGQPLVRADLVVPPGDTARLTAGLRRVLGRAPQVARKARVVVVEDELEILDFTRFLLEREGYEVVCLTSGDEALSSVRADCDLVILDIALEGTDGIEICRRFKSQETTRAVPVLIMTAMSGEDVRQGSLGAGAEGYLLKPFGVDEFLRQVRLHLRRETA